MVRQSTLPRPIPTLVSSAISARSSSSPRQHLQGEHFLWCGVNWIAQAVEIRPLLLQLLDCRKQVADRAIEGDYQESVAGCVSAGSLVTAQVAGGSRTPEVCDQIVRVCVQGLQ